MDKIMLVSSLKQQYLNIKHPKYLQAYRGGYQSFRIGVFNNPFPEGTIRHKEWIRGWNRAYFVNKSKLEENVTQAA